MACSDLTFTRSTCRLCHSSNLWKAIPLNPLPIASPNVGQGARITETAPADVYQCRDCGFLQLNTVVNPEFQYRNFQYMTGISIGLREHFETLIDRLARSGDIGAGKFVFDIGSNDGSLLALAKRRGARVLGIDPARKIADDATAAGIPTIGDFFLPATAREIRAKYGQADVVISNNTVANIDDLDGLFDGVAEILAPGGIAIVETQYALDVLEKTLLDVIYHEHVSYFTVSPTEKFLAARGMELVDAERIAPKGGSVRFYAQHKGGPRPVAKRVADMMAVERAAGLFAPKLFADFNARVTNLAENIRPLLAESKRRTGRALAYGGSVGCAALVHYFDLGLHVDAIFDDTPLSNFIRTPERDIPVLTGSQLVNEPAADVVVLAWRYIENIAAKQTGFRAAGGRFCRALPDLAFFEC